MWSKTRDILIPKSTNFRDFGYTDKINKKTRDELLITYKYTCRFCGGYYLKYLICSYLSDVKLNDVCCKLCHMITHLNYGNTKDINVCYSEMSQTDIVKKTVEYIIANNTVPQPIEIDINVSQSPISSLEFVNIINNVENAPEELNNYKIFFNDSLNIDFIVANYGENMPMFLNEQKDRTEIDKHIPSENEILLFNKQFNIN